MQLVVSTLKGAEEQVAIFLNKREEGFTIHTCTLRKISLPILSAIVHPERYFQSAEHLISNSGRYDKASFQMHEMN
jgi:hypothetical protein